MFRHRQFEPIAEVRDGASRAPWHRELKPGDEVIVYSQEYPLDNLNSIRVRVIAIEGDRVQGVVSRPTRYFLKDQLDQGDQVDFSEKAIFAFA